MVYALIFQTLASNGAEAGFLNLNFPVCINLFQDIAEDSIFKKLKNPEKVINAPSIIFIIFPQENLLLQVLLKPLLSKIGQF